MKSTIPTIIRSSLMIAAFLALVGCGSAKVEKDAKDQNTVQDDSNALLAECNPFKSSSMSLEGKIAVQYDINRITGEWVFIDNEIRMKLSQTPAGVVSLGSSYLQFFRWAGDSNTKQLDTQPVQILIEDTNTRMVWNREDPLTSLSRASLAKFISDYGLGITVDQLVKNATFILVGMDLSYEGLRIAQYDTTKGTQAQRFLDVLIPAFPASPKVYAKTHSNVLLQTHPLYSKLNENMSDTEYSSLLCSRF